MKVALLMAAVALVSGCRQSRQNEEPKSINELADRLDAQLNSGLEDTISAIKAEVKAKCGVALTIPDVPRIVNGTVYAAWVEPSATPAQIACAQTIDPDFKAAPK